LLKKMMKIPNYFYIIISLIILIFGISVFWTGFHNVDICHNERIIGLKTGYELKERTLNKGIWSLSDCYLTGLDMLSKGLYISLVGVFGIGFFIRGDKR